MRTPICLGLLLLSLATPGALGSHFGDFYVVPVAGHVSGVGGSKWQTDVIIHNFGTAPLTVEIGLVESGLGESDAFFPVLIDGAPSVTIPPGETRVLSDLLLDHRGRASAMGALLIGGDRPFALTSRTYSVEPSGATVGQTVPAAQEFFSAPGQRAYVPGLIANTNFRSNIGFVAAAGPAAPLVLEIAITGATGSSLGSTTFAIAPGTISHLQISSSAVTSTPFDIATATIRILSGSGDVTTYGSVIDNRSNHATFASGGVPGSPTAGASLFAARLAGLTDQK